MLVLTNGLLIDGKGGKPVPKATVVVEGNRISAAGSQVQHPAGATVVDVKGGAILPGLIDTHIHAGGTVELKSGKPNFGGAELTTDFADARDSCILHGVTTFRSGGDFFPDIKQTRDKVAAGKLVGPRIFFHGPIFQPPNGHPGYTVWQADPTVLKYAARLVDDPAAARNEVKKLVDDGVDYIKVIVGCLDVWNYPRKVNKLTVPVLAALADETHKLKRRISVHCECPLDALDAVRVGADSIEHIINVGADPVELPEELVQRIVSQGTFVVPTLTITGTYDGRNPKCPLRYEILKKVIKRVYDAGGKIVVGTDSGAPDIYFGKTVHLEMQRMVDLGMTSMDAILAATRRAAENLGTEAEMGTVEKGKLADVIVVSGNPVKNIADTMNVQLVIKDGRVLFDKVIAGETAKGARV